MQVKDVNIKWLGHAGFFIKNSKNIYIDPFKIPENSEKADLILITHSHYDHCSLEDINKITRNGTKIIMPSDCSSKITKIKEQIKMQVINPGEILDFEDINITAFPSYNIDKSFHPKEESWLGYLIKINNIILYHAGDTDLIPEMQKLTGYKQEGKEFIALLPIGGRFTMSAEEAAEATQIIKPDIAIPMHYGEVIGNNEDAQEFKELCEEKGIKVKIMEKED
ncbi:MAG: MBL fold metallo-hydrolase [Nanoarchaeota archaeon]